MTERELFEAAVELGQEERDSLLAAACADDPTLAHELKLFWRNTQNRNAF